MRLLLVLLTWPASQGRAAEPDRTDFARDVRPILAWISMEGKPANKMACNRSSFSLKSSHSLTDRR